MKERASRGCFAALYGRSDVMASNASHTAVTLAYPDDLLAAEPAGVPASVPALVVLVGT